MSRTATGPSPVAGAVLTTRFAPSPTGLLHLGHAASALGAWHRARAAGGRFLLRIEDIDAGRCRAEWIAAIQDDLAWLGLDWDGVPRQQSRCLAEYEAVLRELAARDLLYPCFCTRAAIAREWAEAGSAPHRAPDGALRYPGTCRDLDPALVRERIAAGADHALRLRTDRALSTLRAPLTRFEEGQGRLRCHPKAFGDPVLARRDVPASYHLCVTHDDALQGVTLVTRGVDLEPATDLHRLLQAVMGWPEPGYAHHPLLLDDAGRRLAKRDQAQTLRAMRDAGMSAQAVRRAAGFP
ncbi:tRNA glutamyl-Q(34) synthetase GluQRS [Rhizosaccharibacter radicis]|uniref:tRNA glutamyl-Q(34) synthetase GluQRS n=1 Tax=Rhizosaccharibacter radicis TaxID=2782605 RepID=A0ABT1VWP3_9PROT|nr:tRNA glutamyl-Q(34) synthetase GluQRS [Acetobacteraceae bacterium KSS12]